PDPVSRTVVSQAGWRPESCTEHGRDPWNSHSDGSTAQKGATHPRSTSSFVSEGAAMNCGQQGPLDRCCAPQPGLRFTSSAVASEPAICLGRHAGPGLGQFLGQLAESRAALLSAAFSCMTSWTSFLYGRGGRI